MEKIEKLNRWDKIYLDINNTKESYVNNFLNCRDGIVEVCQYFDDIEREYERLFICEDAKHDSYAIIKQTWSSIDNEWKEQCMYFSNESFKFLKCLLDGDNTIKEYLLVRSYME